jgi:CBS domain containing-hemolysin-like protein
MLVGIFTLFIAFVLGIGSEALLQLLSSFWVALVLLVVIILLGIGFDLIGTAVTAATISPFNARAAKKVFGANQAVRLLNNASAVANYCNDVIGDICGTLSGAIGASIALKALLTYPTLDAAMFSALVTGLVAGLTVGGKALGKSVAISNANAIIFRVAVVLGVIEKKTRLTFFGRR